MKVRFALPALAALACAGHPAGAAEPGTGAADALFESGKAAMDHGDLVTACRDLSESLKLDHAAGTLLNLGECEARSGKLATALAHYREGRAGLADGDFRVAFAEEKIASLSKRAPRLAVEVSGERAPGARVTLDGAVLPDTSLGVPLPIDPGTHVAALEGDPPLRVSVTLAEGDTKSVALVQARAPAPAPAPALAPPSAPADEGSHGASQRFAGAVALGSGAVALVVGAVLGVTAKITYDSASSPSNCPNGPASCDAAGVSGGSTAHTEATVSTVLFVAAGVLGATGGVLYLTAPSERRVGLVPAVDGHGAGFLLRGTF
jgi:hypothetical protein